MIIISFIILYKKGTCQNKQHIYVTVAPSEIRKKTVLSVINGWEVIKYRLSFVVVALLEIRKITVLNVINGWEVIKHLLMYAIVVGSEIRKVIV